MASGAALMIVVASAAAAADTSGNPGPRPHADAADVPGSPLDISTVTFGQRGDGMAVDLATTGRWAGGQLSREAGRYICVKLFYGKLPNPRARICVGKDGSGTGLRYTRLDPFGNPFRVRPLAAKVSRRDDRSVQATFTTAAAGLRVGRYSWQAETAWTDSTQCATPGACTDRAPDNGNVIARIRAIALEPKGCFPRSETQRSRGSATGRRSR